MSFVLHKFTVPSKIVNNIKLKTPKFGYNNFGDVVYCRTYARKKVDGNIENWNDTILRVVGGTFSILKSHMIKNHLRWDEEYWSNYAEGFADYMFDFKYLVPGRGLFSMGTPVIDKVGSAALNNCGFVSTENLAKSARWTANNLMLGCGIGFDTKFNRSLSYPINKRHYVIEDSRESWADSIHDLIDSFMSKSTNYKNDNYLPQFDYSKIRPAGMPLKSFGGVSAGSSPLIKLHNRIKTYLFTKLLNDITKEKWINNDYGLKSDLNEHVVFILKEIKSYDNQEKEYFNYMLTSYSKYSNTRLVADIFNAIGACTVAGNIRRSSEIALGSPDDSDFINLKNYEINPERSNISWMSNNSVVLNTDDEIIKYLPSISKRLVDGNNGEPGILNAANIRNFGRINKYSENEEWTREREIDKAIGINPCAEIPLESYELCNLSEIFPSKCVDASGEFSEEIFYKAIEYATFYSSVVSLLPTDSEETNTIIARNRRIGAAPPATC